MSEFTPITIQLEPAIAELLVRIADNAGTTPEAMAIEAVTNMVIWVVNGGNEGDPIAREAQLENQIEGQLAYIQDSMSEFDG
jgi:hypothetical protein